MADNTNASDATATGDGDKASGSAATTDAAEATKVAELPKWAQDELSRARNDAASYRARLKDAKSEVEADVRKGFEDKLLAAQNEKTELQNKLTDSQLFGLKIDAALAVGVPGDHLKAFADRLRGDTFDDIKKDAETIKQTFGVGATGRATDRTAGLGNDKPSTPDDALGGFIGQKLGWK